MPLTLLRRTLTVAIDPADAFRALYGASPAAFWLDNGSPASSGMSYLGAATAVLRPHSWHELLAVLAPPSQEPGGVGGGRGDADDTPRFRLGWVGWLEYELGTRDEELAGRTLAGHVPVACLLRVERALQFDHATGVITLLALDTADAEAWFDETERVLKSVARARQAEPSSNAQSTDSGHGASGITARPRHDFARYAQLVERCQELIAEGEAYQLCLTNRFEVDGEFDPLPTYLRLRAVSPTAHGGFIHVDGTALLSASPERFLAVTAAGRVSTSPVKGTTRRGTTPADDQLMIDELAASAKEQAENLMIVDLMRNDLARVCELGTVTVTSLLEVETLPQVHQLVSTIEGQLTAGLSARDAIAACFPAGSMTGAPKRSAIRHLAELEQGPRGIFSGAFGYITFDGAAELSMVIRSIVISPEGTSVGAGGGITASSAPDAEVEETRLKARALLGVLNAELPPWP